MLTKNVPVAEDAARSERRSQFKRWWRTRRAEPAASEEIAWEKRSDGELWKLILKLPNRKSTQETSCNLTKI